MFTMTQIGTVHFVLRLTFNVFRKLTKKAEEKEIFATKLAEHLFINKRSLTLSSFAVKMINSITLTLKSKSIAANILHHRGNQPQQVNAQK